ncbi:MAG: O-antigen ligase family protein [Pseudomonadota bacterium]
MRGAETTQGPAYPLSVLLFCASVLLGGATRAGALGDALLQILSVPCLLVALWMWLDRMGATGGWRAMLLTRNGMFGGAFAGLGAMILLAQLLPLFGGSSGNGIWTEIVRRGGSGAPAVGTGTSSLAPDASTAAIAAILPALALFLLVALLDARARMRLVGWMVALGLLSLVLGVLQVMTGPTSPLRFHWPTNPQEAVGFFANRNHFAAQMYATLLLGIVWLTHRWRGRFAGPRFTAEKAQAVGVAVSFALLVMGAIVLARSRAGIGLALLSVIPLILAAPAMIAILSGRPPALFGMRTKVAGAVAILLLFIATLGAERAMPRFETSVLNDLRVPILVTSASAVADALPFGSGLGTFVPVYQVHEPGDQALNTYINRAHNDWIEFLLESGIPGGVLILTFLAWFLRRFIAVWFRPKSSAPQDLLTRFSGFILLLFLLHSALDYPLRTAAILGYFAVFCAFLLPPPVPEADPSHRRNQSRPPRMAVQTAPPARGSVVTRE